MLPMLVLVLVEVSLLAAALRLSDVTGRLDQNARDLVAKQVETRHSYIEGEMVGNWSDLSLLAASVNQAAQALLDSGEISLETLETSSDACAPLLLSVTDELISTLYAKRLSGAFIVLNTTDLSAAAAAGEEINRPGIYIRDMDPASAPSYRNADLLLERAPIAVVRALRISTDSCWHPRFSFSPADADGYFDILYQPFQAALAAESVDDPGDCGYWNAHAFTLPGSAAETITYSLPLVLKDGTVYGVLGVEVLADYLKTLLPFEELFSDRQGAYLLAVEGPEGEFAPVLRTGPLYLRDEEVPLALETTAAGDAFVHLGGEEFYLNAQYLRLYSSNTPFAAQRWALIGMVRTRALSAFSRQMTGLLALVVAVTFLAGLTGCLIVSRRLSRPIRALAEDVDRAQKSGGGIPVLAPTGIREIDRFSTAITSLSRQVVDSSTRFLRIMDMASVDIAGFEIRAAEHSLFVTENYFPLLGRQDVDIRNLSVERFAGLAREIDASLAFTRGEDGSTLYRVPLPDGETRYVRIEVTAEPESTVGLAEDVTAATLERLRIEHERDYDLLTGLLNRRAFYRLAQDLFRRPDELGHAALLMMDMDNLKRVNDLYGHDLGDQYIRSAGECFARSVPGNTLCARVSGDEFYFLFYGYACREDIRAAVDRLSQAIRASVFETPSGERMRISASGGIAWYPEDSADYHELMRYADFAMYQVKQSAKGRVGDFDVGVYNREIFLLQNLREFRALLEQEQLSYHFQPLVDAATGRTRAYEALMRVDLPTLRSPEAVLRLARQEGRLADVERLTWFKAIAAYRALAEQGLVEKDARLFINSIASQCLSDADCETLRRLYGDLGRCVVAEITESDDLDPLALRAKRAMPGFSGLFALDDYGSGYNSEKNLLALTPQYIKVDISIIRDIDSSLDKQQIVANIVRYAHERGILIVAEGLETAAEVRTALALNVDLLQGYYLARPAAVPPRINPDALALLCEARAGQS